jgi:hypothetical protein
MRFLIAFLLLSTSFLALAQPNSCDKLDLQPSNEIVFKCADQAMTMIHDNLDKPYLYVANKAAGLTIYSLASKDPRLVGSIPIDSFDGLHVMGVTQRGALLYIALGDFFSATQASGMAIIDVQDPEKPSKVGFWKYSVATEGASMVLVEGDYAYLAAFSHGLFILNISVPNDIKLISKLTPDLDYPDSNPDASKINARGMVLENNVVYLCYDAGGLRIINVQDKTKPRETGRYSNPVMNGKPRAYNNLVKKDSLLYIGVDYCGMEILNVSDTTNITEVSWWNPWKCHESGLKWFTSPGHVNEIRLDSLEMKLFVSSGKSDLHVIDVADPQNPDSCTLFGGVDNKIGTWGVSIYKNEVYLSYICTIVPFSSNWAGVKMLKYQRSSSLERDMFKLSPRIFPNPVSSGGNLQIEDVDPPFNVKIFNIQGQEKLAGESNQLVDINGLSAGIYWLQIENSHNTWSTQLMIAD